MFKKPSFAEQVRDLLESLSPDDIDGVEKLRPLYDADVVFQDPIQKVQGIDAFIALNRRLLGRAKQLSFAVHEATEADDQIFLTWTMHCVPKLGPKIQVDGASHLQTRKDRVVMHRDYWDLGEMFASAVPGGQAALRFLLKPLA